MQMQIGQISLFLLLKVFKWTYARLEIININKYIELNNKQTNKKEIKNKLRNWSVYWRRTNVFWDLSIWSRNEDPARCPTIDTIE